MTRLLYVGNFKPEHSTESHVRTALTNLGHECLPIQESGLDWSTLPGLVSQNQPDVLLWTRTAGFDPADLEGQERAIKSLNVPSVGFHLDRWWGLNREGDIRRSPFFRVDYLFTADGGHDAEWRDAGVNHYWSPPAILSDEAKRVGNFRPDYAADVGFVGSMRKYGHPEWGPYRLSLFKFLVKTYGSRFKLWEGGIRGQDLADLYASVKVLVGDSCLAGGATKVLPGGVHGGARVYQSDRIPETIGRGGFLIHPRVEGITDGTLYTEGRHLACYELGDFDELRTTIDHYLENPEERATIARDGRAYCQEFHTYERRLGKVLEIVLGETSVQDRGLSQPVA